MGWAPHRHLLGQHELGGGFRGSGAHVLDLSFQRTPLLIRARHQQLHLIQVLRSQHSHLDALRICAWYTPLRSALSSLCQLHGPLLPLVLPEGTPIPKASSRHTHWRIHPAHAATGMSFGLLEGCFMRSLTQLAELPSRNGRNHRECLATGTMGLHLVRTGVTGCRTELVSRRQVAAHTARSPAGETCGAKRVLCYKLRRLGGVEGVNISRKGACMRHWIPQATCTTSLTRPLSGRVKACPPVRS